MKCYTTIKNHTVKKHVIVRVYKIYNAEEKTVKKLQDAIKSHFNKIPI